METLLECEDLQQLHSLSPAGGTKACAVEKRIADCEAILDYGS